MNLSSCSFVADLLLRRRKVLLPPAGSSSGSPAAEKKRNDRDRGGWACYDYEFLIINLIKGMIIN
jgi:hypothetical protein